MKKFLVILFCFLNALFLLSCDVDTQKPAVSQTSQTSLNHSHSQNTDISQISEDESTDEQNHIYYVLNKNTKKIHLPSCRSAKAISSKNYATTDDLQSALDNGYEKCKNCNP